MGAASITTVIKEQHQNYIEKSTMSDWITAESKADKKAKAQTANPKSTSKPRAQGPAQGQGQRSNNQNQKVTAKVVSNSQAKAPSKPPQKLGGFATMVNAKPPTKPVVQKEVAVDDVYVARDMTRSYELTRAPPAGTEAVLKKTFPSMDVCVVNSVEVNGRALPSLFVHFSEDHKSAYDDYDRAANVNISVQGIGLRLTAVALDKTDGDGVVIPKLNMLIQATGMPFSLARNPSDIKEVLGQYVEFDARDGMKLVYEDGLFRGQVVIPVAVYKKVPPTQVVFPFYTMNSYGNYEKVENATCKVGIACRGYDASKASPLDFKKNMGQRQQII